jgi:hypothetical protein
MTVCLPLIGPIGSRRTPAVFVMESTHAWHLHHPALARPLRSPRLGRVSFAKTSAAGQVVDLSALILTHS